METTIVYTDGSHIPGQDGRGYSGMGIWFGPNDKRNESRPLDGEHITHQYAELKAIEVAIKYCRYMSHVEIITDSRYSVDCVTTWANSWERNGWMTSKGHPVLHSDIIQSIRAILSNRSSQGMSTKITHVRGHKGVRGNEEADKLAHAASKSLEQLYMSKVYYFDGGKLSNFYFSDISTKYNGINQNFNCVEQFYQYHKAIRFNDQGTADTILSSGSQYIQKNLGRSVKGFNQDEWDQVKEDVMLYGVMQKFKQHKDLLNFLISTRNALIVESRPDNEWGIGISRSDAMKGVRWSGKNLLGKILMKVRSELK